MPDRIEQLKKMLAAEPDDAFCLYGLAQEYAKLGQLAAAIEHYDRALAADPAYHYAYFHKAKAQEEAGDAAGAITTLQTGLKRASAAGDAKATGEIGAYLDELS